MVYVFFVSSLYELNYTMCDFAFLARIMLNPASLRTFGDFDWIWEFLNFLRLIDKLNELNTCMEKCAILKLPVFTLRS